MVIVVVSSTHRGADLTSSNNVAQIEIVIARTTGDGDVSDVDTINVGVIGNSTGGDSRLPVNAEHQANGPQLKA